jgi:GTP-binding protein
LDQKRELVILNKSDLVNHETEALEKVLKKAKITVFLSISAATNHNIDELKKKLLKIVLEERKTRTKEEDSEREEKAAALPVLQPHLEEDQMDNYRIDEQADGSIRIKGKRLEQFTVMTDFDNESAVRRFQDVLQRIGLRKNLQKRLRKANVPVYIGEVRIEEYV